MWQHPSNHTFLRLLEWTGRSDSVRKTLQISTQPSRVSHSFINLGPPRCLLYEVLSVETRSCSTDALHQTSGDKISCRLRQSVTSLILQRNVQALFHLIEPIALTALVLIKESFILHFISKHIYRNNWWYIHRLEKFYPHYISTIYRARRLARLARRSQIITFYEIATPRVTSS